ncbi:MAG TPA: NAD(P)-dependent oxidoreductase [Acholeplasmataceae bacterium]|nr:NAD(P)-dependent oxidoreductase [Acholeplasmataceae bacterium]
MKIAWIGTGVMGNPMAHNLHKANYNVHVYNRTSSKAFAMETLGLKAHETIKSCVKDANYIFMIVGYPKDVLEVTNEIFKYAKEDAIIIDMTTSSPTLAKKLYDEGLTKGFNLLDAPVTGGDLGAINGNLSIMVGGLEEVFNQVKPLFEQLGKTINYMGNAGSGQHAKLANQAAIAGAIAGVAESLAYAKEKGLNLEKMLDVITKGSASSWQAVNNGAKMIIEDNLPGFYIKHFLKDLNLILDEAKTFSPLVVKQVQSIYSKLTDKGYQDLGTQAILKYYLDN